MDPVSVLVAAVLAGSATGVSGVAAAAVRDAYASFRKALHRRLVGRAGAAPGVVDVMLADPAGQRDELERIIAAANIGSDEPVVAEAQQLMRLMDPDGWAAGTYDLRGAKGVMFGSGNIQFNDYSDRGVRRDE